MVITTQNGHISFRSEEIAFVAQIPSDETIESLNTNTIKFSNKIKIGFKSGGGLIIVCDDAIQASELLKIISDTMKKD